MDILDILIAKNQSFSAETAKLTKQAQAAMAKANKVAAKIDEAQDALDAAEAANTRAQEIAEEFDALEQNLNEAVDDIIDDKLENALSPITSSVETLEQNSITAIEIVDNNTSAIKNKKINFTKNNTQETHDIVKNYTATGTNEDGSMTQKAITNALNAQKTELENKINNIRPSGGSSGNISGITPKDEGSMVTVDKEGAISPSTITERDIILTQIISGTYNNNDIIGLEIDYSNKTFTRLQGAKGLNAGADFDKFTMLGGRKRCIVNKNGSIERFLTSEDTLASVSNKRIMVYQPPVYYLRVPISTTITANGIKINKEQIYISDKKYAGFELHPIFKDTNNEPVKYVLLPAYESGTLRANGNFEKNDAQDINFATDKLVSITETKPISGYTQEFTYAAAEQMAHNNGAGWELTDLRFESLNQMLLSIEYGSLNLQATFNKGLSTINNNSNTNISSLSGSTHSLLNTSGQALSTTSAAGDIFVNEGRCAISYRGLENPYGNIWRFIGGVEIQGNNISYNNEEIAFSLPTTNGWINAFGYDEEHDWVFLPIEVGNGASSSLPVGDLIYADNTETIKSGLAGGLVTSQENCGPFYYMFTLDKTNYHYRSDSARVMFIPTANSSIETNNYNLWKNL